MFLNQINKELFSLFYVFIYNQGQIKRTLKISLILVNNQTQERVFHEISKHWELGWKNEALPSFFEPTSKCLDI